MAHPKQFETAFETYKTIRQVGQGGAGYVLEVAAAGGSFALKYLEPSSVTDERRRRFKNEISFCRTIHHPNIIRVIDTGVHVIDKVRCPFYVMPLYDSTLRKAQAGLCHDDILPLFGKILDGVEAAHLKGVYHRDLKPENILVTTGCAELVVSDFGIAHFTEEFLATQVETKKTSRLASFAYAAPEQRIPDQLVDHRADIYALGLMLNELFTGVLPHGTGYKLIASLVLKYGYLDSLVELMVRQDPGLRPASIRDIKRALIARENEFISQQRIDELSKRVIPTHEVTDDLIADPPTVIGADYEGGNLLFELSSRISRDWLRVFKNPARTGMYEYIAGKAPRNYGFDGVHLTIPAEENEVKKLIQFTKKYVGMANRGYQQDVIAAQRQREEAERKKIKEDLAQEERRQRIQKQIHDELGA